MSASFNGTSSSIALPSGFFDYERTQAFSISANAYFTGNKSGSLADYAIFSKLASASPNNGIEFSFLWTADVVTPNYKLVLQLYLVNNFGTNNRITVDGSTDIAANAWVNCVVTYSGSGDASGVKMYVNGARETEAANKNSLSASIKNSITPRIGSRNAASTWFKGELQNVGFWDVELTADECKSLGVGFTPDKIRPQNLQMYVPLVREVIDIKGNALTASNMSVGSNNPRIYA